MEMRMANDAVASTQCAEQQAGACDLSIVICTYRRPALLESCLRSCLQQRVPTGATCEIVVVDNDYERSALPVMAAARGPSRIPLRYFNEPIANIARARNRGVREARGEFIAFIDDDLHVPETWLATVLRVLRGSGADVLLGDVRPIFEGSGAPPGVARAWTRHAPDRGGVVAIRHDGNVPGCRTSNAVFRRSSCFIEQGHWFDPAFGRSGSEDSEFFLRLGRRRPQIISSAEAWVCEFVPQARQSEAYLLIRAEREGRGYARAVLKNAKHPRLRAIDLAARGLMQVLVYSSLLACRAVLTNEHVLGLRIRRALALGKAMLAGAPQDQPYR
jgi:succinoglycan biosynthesis protein ExoM